jgi:hypothetical protein
MWIEKVGGWSSFGRLNIQRNDLSRVEARRECKKWCGQK